MKSGFRGPGKMVANVMKKFIHYFCHREDNSPIEEGDEAGLLS